MRRNYWLQERLRDGAIFSLDFMYVVQIAQIVANNYSVYTKSKQN